MDEDDARLSSMMTEPPLVHRSSKSAKPSEALSVLEQMGIFEDKAFIETLLGALLERDLRLVEQRSSPPPPVAAPSCPASVTPPRLPLAPLQLESCSRDPPPPQQLQADHLFNCQAAQLQMQAQAQGQACLARTGNALTQEQAMRAYLIAVESARQRAVAMDRLGQQAPHDFLAVDGQHTSELRRFWSAERQPIAG